MKVGPPYVSSLIPCSWQIQNFCHPLGNLPSGRTFILLDFFDRCERTAHFIRQNLLCQVKCLALSTDPMAKRICGLHCLTPTNNKKPCPPICLLYCIPKGDHL